MRWPDPIERLMSKTRPQGECLVIDVRLTADGYAKFRVGDRHTTAHRYTYERLVGPIPDGHQIDHLCKVRNCVRIDHLEAVTPRENLLRSPTWGGRNAAKTQCPQGHPYDGVTAGRRICHPCRREATRRWRQAKSAQTADVITALVTARSAVPA